MSDTHKTCSNNMRKRKERQNSSPSSQKQIKKQRTLKNYVVAQSNAPPKGKLASKATEGAKSGKKTDTVGLAKLKQQRKKQKTENLGNTASCSTWLNSKPNRAVSTNSSEKQALMPNIETLPPQTINNSTGDQQKEAKEANMGDLTTKKMEEMLAKVEQNIKRSNAEDLRAEMTRIEICQNNHQKKLTEQMTTLESNLRSEIAENGKVFNTKAEEIIVSLENTQQDVKELKTETGKTIKYANKLADVVNCLSVKVEVLIVQNEELKRRCIQSEDQSYGNNLLIFEVPEDKNEKCENIAKIIFKDKLKITETDDMKINACFRDGPYQKNRKRPIKVKFDSKSDKNAVLAARKNLPRDSDIKMAEQFSTETTARRKVLGPLVKVCRDADKKATLIGDQLLVDGRKYSVETVHRLEGIDFQIPATRKNDKVLAFNGRLSVLSNFYYCKFDIDKTAFYSNEQYFQYNRAIAASKGRTASMILATKDPVEQKTLGGSTRLPDDQWNSYECMKAGAIAKFAQNKSLWDCLKETEGLELQHANAYDRVYGIGVSLFDKDLFKKPGRGSNLLGKMLMDIRDNNLVLTAGKGSKGAYQNMVPEPSAPNLTTRSESPMEQELKRSDDGTVAF